MTNWVQIRNSAALFSLITLSACVSASQYSDMKIEHDKTTAALSTCESEKADLERRLGISSSEKTELEGSVATMKRALSELQIRKAETEKRLNEFRELTEKFKELVDAGKLSVKVRNGRMMLALSSDILFASGSAKLSQKGTESIQEVASLLKDLKNRNFQIEGHTDNVPIHTKIFSSNWELASTRAESVLNTMLAVGFPPEHVSTASYGKYDPLNDNSTPEARAENRRIAIVVVPDLSSLPGFDELNRMSPKTVFVPPVKIATPEPEVNETANTPEVASTPAEPLVTSTPRRSKNSASGNADEPMMSAVPEIATKGTPIPEKLPDLQPTEPDVKFSPVPAK